MASRADSGRETAAAVGTRDYWVLGEYRCGSSRCDALVRSTRRRRALSTSRLCLRSVAGDRRATLAFASARDGFAYVGYGSRLYDTRDGGKSASARDRRAGRSARRADSRRSHGPSHGWLASLLRRCRSALATPASALRQPGVGERCRRSVRARRMQPSRAAVRRTGRADPARRSWAVADVGPRDGADAADGSSAPLRRRIELRRRPRATDAGRLPDRLRSRGRRRRRRNRGTSSAIAPAERGSGLGRRSSTSGASTRPRDRRTARMSA